MHKSAFPLTLVFLIIITLLAALEAPVQARERLQATPTPPPGEGPLDAPDRVEVEPQARDEEIEQRLQDIMVATGWFRNPEVRVQDGVAFLMGQTETADYRTWAGDLARSTQDVAAVVNQIDVLEPSVWDFQPALAGLRDQLRSTMRALPLIGLSLIILLLTLGAARMVISGAHNSLQRRRINPLLRSVFARGAGLVVFLLGLYVVFHVAGLTGVALTVVGGTGLLGLVVGIAFRDITENFLASIFLSVQNPFHTGDLVDIGGTEGFVQTLTARATLLMTPDGNHVQIPNATVYKSVIFNYTSNPNRREEFAVGIGYEGAITAAQELVFKVLAEHPAVLADPEAMVLVEGLGSATVNLRVYFWLDGSQHSPLKVKSSVIRLVKRAFQEAQISMPGEERMIHFSGEIPLRLLGMEGAEAQDAATHPPRGPRPTGENASATTEAEGGLRSEAQEIERQARQSRPPEEGQNLLDPPERKG